MYVSSPAFSALILRPDHISFPALRIALHVLIPSQFYSPVVPGLDCLDHRLCPYLCFHMTSRRSNFHVDNHVTRETVSQNCSLWATENTPSPSRRSLPTAWKCLHMHWICDTTMFIQNGEPGDFRTQTNIFMASLSTPDLVWFVHGEQFLKRICGTIIIREIYTHPSVFLFLNTQKIVKQT